MIGLEVAAAGAVMFGAHGGSANAVEHRLLTTRPARFYPAPALASPMASERSHFAATLERTGTVFRAAFDDAKIEVVLDQDNYEFHIDAKDGYSRAGMRAVLMRCASWGYELMEDECDLGILEDGTVRKWLVPFTQREV